MHVPATLTEAVRYYADEQVCIDTVASLRWPEGKPVCPKCDTQEAERRHYWLQKQKRWKCYACRKQFSVKVNSLFEDSPLGLDKWLIALWMLCNCKNGVSSHEIARELGIAQKSAWHLLHRLRSALQSPDAAPLGSAGGNVVELDEAFIGGEPKNKHLSQRQKGKYIKDESGITYRNPDFKSKAGRGTDKVAVFGILDREARKVRAQVIPAVKREVLMDAIIANVEKGSTVYTDGLAAYDSLLLSGFMHQFVNHTTEYVRGEVHTNGIENFWSLLKRGLKGTYISVEPFHLHRYIDEQAFRYEHRATKDTPYTNADRFAIALMQIAGKRLTWKDLTGKEEGSF
jgi:transposase-like protein